MKRLISLLLFGMALSASAQHKCEHNGQGECKEHKANCQHKAKGQKKEEHDPEHCKGSAHVSGIQMTYWAAGMLRTVPGSTLLEFRLFAALIAAGVTPHLTPMR